MNKYEVVSGCYVPIGSGSRYKAPGQIVTLSDEHAALLAAHIRPVDPSGGPEPGVAKRNTEPEAVEPEAVKPEEPEVVERPFGQPFSSVTDGIAEGVTSDFRYPEADHE